MAQRRLRFFATPIELDDLIWPHRRAPTGLGSAVVSDDGRPTVRDRVRGSDCFLRLVRASLHQPDTWRPITTLEKTRSPRLGPSGSCHWARMTTASTTSSWSLARLAGRCGRSPMSARRRSPGTSASGSGAEPPQPSAGASSTASGAGAVRNAPSRQAMNRAIETTATMIVEIALIWGVTPNLIAL